MATTKKNKVGVISILLISGILFGYCVGYILGKSSDLLGQISWVWVIISVPFLYYFSVAWHELGHALAGLSVGFDWRVYVVGPFYFEKKDLNWQFSWNKNVNLSGGMVVALPTQSNGIAASFQWYILGGPLSSLFGFLLFLGFSVFAQDTLRLIFILLALFHVALFFATAIPFRLGGFFSDGKRFLRLRKNSPVSDLEVRLLSFMTKIQQGILPRYWPEEEINQMIFLASNLGDPYLVFLKSFAFQRALDIGNVDQAAQSLTEYIDLKDELPDSFQSMVWLDSAYFHAYLKKDWEKATEDLNKFKEFPFISKSYIYATRAEIAWAKGDLDEFELWKSKFWEKLPKMLDKSQSAALTERFILPRIS